MPICGLEKGLEQNLRSILEQDYPAPHQVVLSAQREDEPALPLLRRLAEEYGPETGASAFCLGSSVAFRRSTLEAIGGLEPLAEFLVEDFEMGRRMRALGLRLALVRRPVDSIIDLASARAWWQHQIYREQNTRHARPKGFFASILVRPLHFVALLAARRARVRELARRLAGSAAGADLERRIADSARESTRIADLTLRAGRGPLNACLAACDGTNSIFTCSPTSERMRSATSNTVILREPSRL
jgi:GT2 family glycosyltransferase